MKKLSVSEFADFCKEKNPSCYILSSVNQEQLQHSGIYAVFRFHKIIINLNPDRICFVNEHDKLNIEHVKSVKIYDDKPCVGTVFKIYCDNAGAQSVLTLVMD